MFTGGKLSAVLSFLAVRLLRRNPAQEWQQVFILGIAADSGSPLCSMQYFYSHKINPFTDSALLILLASNEK